MPIKNARFLAGSNRAVRGAEDYLEDFMTGGGAFGLGQQETANNEAVTAIMASIAIFILVV